MKGKIIILSAPSGAGKSSIIKELMKMPELRLRFSISATSRSPRGNEEHGKDYFFLTKEEFDKKISTDSFVEWEEVYKGIRYGTLVSEIQRITEEGNNVIMDVDVKGALNIKKRYDKESLSLFIMPPDINILEERLRKRNTDSEEMIKERVNKASHELEFAKDFDGIIINDKLEVAVGETADAIKHFINE